MRYLVTVTGTKGIIANCWVDSMDDALILREIFIAHKGVVEVTITASADNSEALQRDELAGWRS